MEVKEMPDFGHPFSGLAKERKLSDQELIRAIRFMISTKYEAGYPAKNSISN